MNGFFNINKEKGMTSSAVVGVVKGILRSRGIVTKVGHLGTLDPEGEGVLPIALGRATRLFDYFLDKTKVYRTIFSFGRTTDTLDATGVTTAVCEKIPTEAELLAAIPGLCGEVDQLPPAYSAKVVGGVRAYKLARQGEVPDLKPKRVRIEQIRLLERLDARTFRFEVTCGGGTYIRSIARDLGNAVGSLGIMDAIYRTQSGCFCIENACRLDDLRRSEDLAAQIIPMEAALTDFPALTVSPKEEVYVRNGVAIASKLSDGLYRLRMDGAVFGIAEVSKGRLTVRTRLI